MPEAFIVRSVLAAVRSIPDYRGLSVLDLSCGDGEILEALHGDGCRVEGTHYRPDDYILRNPRPVLKQARIHQNVSLDAALPFDSASYDVVLLTEVLEHLPNHFLALREVTRIVRPGGYLVLTTPNISRLHSRFYFLLTGTHKLVMRRIGWDTDLARLQENHINPMDFPLCHALLHIQGMETLSVAATRIKRRHLGLLPLAPLIWLASWREFRVRRGDPAFVEGEADLFRKMMSVPLLLSEQLLIVARKKAEEGRA